MERGSWWGLDDDDHSFGTIISCDTKDCFEEERERTGEREKQKSITYRPKWEDRILFLFLFPFVLLFVVWFGLQLLCKEFLVSRYESYTGNSCLSLRIVSWKYCKLLKNLIWFSVHFQERSKKWSSDEMMILLPFFSQSDNIQSQWREERRRGWEMKRNLHNLEKNKIPSLFILMLYVSPIDFTQKVFSHLLFSCCWSLFSLIFSFDLESELLFFIFLTHWS